MVTLLNYLRLSLLSISGILVLCLVFAVLPELNNGVIMGKICWFHFSMLFLAGTTLLAEIFVNKISLRILLPDILILLFTGVMLITYDWNLNPEPETLMLGGQLLALWFMLRVAFNNNPSLRLFFLSILLCIGFVESVIGIQQLYGVIASHHTYFQLTGSFFNPGPFSGFLAIILPIGFSMVVRFSNCPKGSWWEMRTILYYLGWICTIAILLILPAGMSRSAWLAAGISCLWVYWAHRIGWRKTKESWSKHRNKIIVISLISATVLGFGLNSIYQIKKDSADGRLLIWKVTTQAFLKQPIKGVGIGGFPAKYAESQAEYFTSGKATEHERIIAGSPAYAFNEYLQFALELGIGGLILFVSWICMSFYYGIKNRRIGPAGSILSLAIFSLSAYPLQLPSFWVILIFVSVICVTGSKPGKQKKRWYMHVKLRFVGVVAALISFSMWYLQRYQYDAYKEWGSVKALYKSQAYDVAAEKYETLYPQLHHVSEYLFEYAQSLSKCGRPEKANELLNRAIKLNSDPMIHYMIAKNNQSLGFHLEAEKRLYYAIDMLPERIYPYYLLTKLYADPMFYREEKLRTVADSVLVKEPKVHTTAITEMREEVRKLVSNLNEN